VVGSLLVLGVIASMDCKDAAYCYRCSVVCLCVCLLDTTVSLTKTAEAIEMPFGLWTRVGLGNHVLGGGVDRPVGRGNSGGCFPIRLCNQQTLQQHGAADLSAGDCMLQCDFRMDSPTAGVTSAAVMRPFVRILWSLVVIMWSYRCCCVGLVPADVDLKAGV